jgi:hypothetical protein
VAVVGGGQDDDRHPAQILVRLDPGEDFGSAHVRKVEVEQDQGRAVAAGACFVMQDVVERSGAVGEMDDPVVDPRAPDVLSIRRA